MKNKVGDLQVWWVPQVPMKAFTFAVKDVETGAALLTALAEYDLFQLKHNIKPDFCNAGGLNRWVADSDGDGTPGWESWYDEETGEEDPEDFVAQSVKA